MCVWERERGGNKNMYIRPWIKVVKIILEINKLKGGQHIF